MNDQELKDLIDQNHPAIQEDQEVADRIRSKIVSQMISAARRETDRLEHHLLEMPLSVIIYQWVIIRLKSRPWRLLVPVSLLLSILVQSLLPRFNIIQFLTH